MQEIKIVTNTGEGQISVSTGLITGELDAVILSAISPVDILIQSELDYVILRKTRFNGTEYVAPRVMSTPSNQDMRAIPNGERFNLNESIIITVSGMKNQSVDLLIRIK